MKRFGEILLASPGLVFAGLVVLIFLSIYPASNIKTDFNLEGFYPEDDRVIKDYEFLEEEFGRDDNSIIVGFQSPEKFNQKTILDIRDLTDKFESIEFISSVQSIWNANQISEKNDRLSFDPYFDDFSEAPSDLNEILQQLAADPFVGDFLINSDATTTAFILQIDQTYNTYPNRNQIIESLNIILEEYRDDYQFHTSGIPYFRNMYVNLLNSEIIIYISISSLLIIFLLWYLYRSIWGVLFPMIIVWTTLLLTIALMELTGGYLEIMSSTIAPILLCVGVADAIHMISKYDDSRESGMDKRGSILEMLTTLGSATFLTSITTAIGFASLLSSTVMPMQKFGLYTALGVLIAYLVTIFFLPVALIKSKKERVFNEKSGSFYPFLKKVLNRIAVLNRRYYNRVLAFGICFVLVFAVGIKNVKVDGKVFDDLGEDTELMQDSRFFTEALSPQFPMEFIIDTRFSDGATQATLLNKIAEFEDKLLSYPEIHRVIGLQTLLHEIHKLFGDGEVEQKSLPQTDAAISQYLLLLEINGDDELYRFVDFDYQKVRVTAFTEDAGSKRINEIRDELSVYIAETFADEEVTITGTTILSADLTDKIVYSLAWSIGIALIAISFIMTLLFKNIRMVFISLIPNIMPLIVVAGIIGFFGINIKPSTAVIFTIALGIAVDDSIHFLARFRLEYMRSRAMFPALTATTIRTGRAIIVTSLVLIAGFGTLISSAFTSTAMMGILVCATIFTALIADLFILPALFYKLKPKLFFKEEALISK